MSIDSAPKRRAISGILSGLAIVGVTPDATPDAAWRQSAGWGYLGIETVVGISGPATERAGAFSYGTSRAGRFAYARKREGVIE